MHEQFKIGDVVVTNIHPYKMTIHEINDKSIICDYFLNGELHRETYDYDELALTA